ncbi:Uncharacterised protein [Mycolicibacterium smegmatis]|nr:Uncharacterised protein [Mycolicibacterium smegmatis]
MLKDFLMKDVMSSPVYKSLIEQVEARLRQVIREELERAGHCGCAPEAPRPGCH